MRDQDKGLGFKLFMAVTAGMGIQRGRASGEDPPSHQLMICCLVCDWQVYGGNLLKDLLLRSLTFIMITGANLSKLLLFCRNRSLE